MLNEGLYNKNKNCINNAYALYYKRSININMHKILLTES